MKKRMIALVCVMLTLCLTLCACGGNEYVNKSGSYVEHGNVSVQPKHVYWDNDTLVAECYIVNGLDRTVYNLVMTELIFGNQNSAFAARYTETPLEGMTIAPYATQTYTFRFSGSEVTAPGAKLNPLGWSTSISYSY